MCSRFDMPEQPHDPILANDFRALWEEVRTDALAAMDRVGGSGWFVLGREVEAFERALAEHAGLGFAVGTANGMDALEIALRAGGLRHGEKVLTTPLSAFASTLAILRAGGKPVFVDVDESGLVDLVLARRAFADDPALRWFLPVHLFGHCLNLDQLQELRDEFGLRIVEDCAQSVGATWRDRPCGTVGFAAATSFYPTKNLGAMGDGGAILTPDAELAAAARQWRDYGQSAKYVHRVAGLNSRLDELQAAILRDAILPRLDRFTKRRREIAAFFSRELRHDLVHPAPEPTGSQGVFHLYPVLVEQDRDGLLKNLKRMQVVAGIHYPSLIPSQPAMREVEAETIGCLEQATRFAACELSLPVHPFLTDSQVEYVVEACHSWRPLSSRDA